MPRKKYPIDITRAQFTLVQGILESAKKKTKPRSVDLYEVFNAALYILKSGASWRMLPDGFPDWKLVHYYFTIWRKTKNKAGATILEQALKKIGRDLAYKARA